MTRRLIANIAERCLRAAGIGYCVAWQQAGLDFDTLARVENLEAATVAAALSLALSMGFLKAGDPQSGGIT